MARAITPNDVDQIFQNISMNLLEMEAGEEELIHSLQYVLEKFRYPLSVSFLNTSFSAWRQKILLNFSFLEKFKSIFSVSMIGSDLKINLRKRYNTNVKREPEFLRQLEQIFEKEFEKCQKLVIKLREGRVLFHDAIKQFSTNKYKMNLGFCVRNSHILDLYLCDGETYIRAMEHVNDNDNMNEKEIWDLIKNDKVDELAVISLKKLLCNFTVPINQGTLQVLINFGFPVVDKSFLRNHKDIFEGGGDNGVLLSVQRKIKSDEKSKSTPPKDEQYYVSPPRPPLNITPFSFSPWETDEDFVDSCPAPVLHYSNTTDPSIVGTVNTALREKCTTVVLGKNREKPPVFVMAGMNQEERLNALLILRGYVEAEIEKIKK